tara:strand:- start:437 stop:2212 length:1776 start_codon:yes stop_codon:yes gene_type:complete
MCGIFFVKSSSKRNLITKERIETIFEIHKERGPDEKKHIVIDDCLMIHTRLAITNPSRGHQPISYSSEKSFMLFNGEIYNYKDLAKQYSFMKDEDYSDTDLLFKLINKVGFTNAIKKLRGMFAIVYYDLENRKIHAARDHFGQKPLYSYKSKDTIAFSSTIKGLITYFGLSLDYSKILHLISKQGKTCPSQTIFNSVGGLRAGEIKEINFELEEECHNYFNHQNIIDSQLYKENLKEPIENFDHILQDTIKIHFDTEAKTGLLLSGGYDSSMLMQYSEDFKKSELCLTKLCPGIEKIPLKVIPKLLEKSPKDILFKILTPKTYFRELFDFIKLNFTIPKWGGTPAMRYLVRDIDFRNIKVIFGGDGVDESLMGYNTHLNFIQQKSENQIHKTLFGEKLLADFSFEDNQKLFRNRKLIEDNLREHLSSKEAFIQSFLFQDSLEFLQRCNLPSADLFSMNESLELRNPFVDLEFMRFALNLPLKWKYNKNTGGKYIFKLLAKEKIGDIFPLHKEGTRNFSRLLSQTNIWNLNQFKVLKLFPVLKDFKSFMDSTKFTIICVELLIRIIDNPSIELKNLDNLFNNEGKSIFGEEY